MERPGARSFATTRLATVPWRRGASSAGTLAASAMTDATRSSKPLMDPSQPSICECPLLPPTHYRWAPGSLGRCRHAGAAVPEEDRDDDAETAPGTVANHPGRL
jgi:hypothetical protein